MLAPEANCGSGDERRKKKGKEALSDSDRVKDLSPKLTLLWLLPNLEDGGLGEGGVCVQKRGGVCVWNAGVVHQKVTCQSAEVCLPSRAQTADDETEAH